MGALEESPKFERIKVAPEVTTRTRRDTERILGRKLPIGQGEINAYLEAGLEPPTE
ncbi:hypothetical protein ACFWBG_29000 [Nocardia salmonicida]|uniref:hypothetical protein n=1 Tax=Nocardia salmonicida TaxID=53431 RepID=UPI0036713BC8